MSSPRERTARREKALALRLVGLSYARIAIRLNCAAETIANDLRGEKPPRPPCRACGEKPASRPKGLCWKCSANASVRRLHVSTSKFGKREAGDGRNPTRKPGEPPCRCLHCSKFRCQGYFEICPECQQIYNELSATMPADDYHEPEIPVAGK